MKIPIGYYIRFWLKNSLLALGTGYVVGMLVIRFFLILVITPEKTDIIAPIAGSTGGLLTYQYIIFSLFWGTRRGHFEYEYRDVLNERNLKKLIVKEYGVFALLRFVLDQFNQTSLYQEDLCKKLVRRKDVKDGDLFDIYMRLSKLALKFDNYGAELENLHHAVALKPNDIVANYRLAVAFERNGSATDAVKHYEAALNSPDISTIELKKYIESQIERVKTKGPTSKPPTLGCKWIIA